MHTTKIIIWDETPMLKWQSIECLDKMLQDINDCNILFGGKVIIVGGDFQQILPIVLKWTREEIINASLLKSYLWPKFLKIKITQNMWVQFNPLFTKYLLWINDEMEKKNVIMINCIKLSSTMIIPYVKIQMY